MIDMLDKMLRANAALQTSQPDARSRPLIQVSSVFILILFCL